MIYAVIDTNVIVSSLLSRKIDTGTVLIRKHILDGTIVPVFNEEIFQEYEDVLHRAKFNLPVDAVDYGNQYRRRPVCRARLLQSGIRVFHRV